MFAACKQQKRKEKKRGEEKENMFSL